MPTRSAGTLLLLLAVIIAAGEGLEAETHSDVLVYGATPAGIAAALAAADDGDEVVLIEPTARIGGLVTSGLSHTDFRTFEGITGTFLDFTRRVEGFYAATFGAESEQAKASFRGTFGEPKVNLAIFRQMLEERRNVVVRTGLRLASVRLAAAPESSRQVISAIELVDETRRAHLFTAAQFIDATYEGDLMAAAGVPWRVGREGRAEYGESLAPEQADEQLQAYNFRFVMTQDPAIRVAPEAPTGYHREDFLDLLPWLESGRIKRVFDYPSNCIFKAHLPPLPNGKYDINDVSRGLIRLSLPGQNSAWPNGDHETRAAVFAAHLRDQVGLLYFLQNDAAVPARFRDEARRWGWCRDEFVETDHLPPQLYVREARRMVGRHVYTQRDSQHAPGDARAVLHPDAIAMGDYGNNCHGTAHEGPRFGGRHTGEFYNPVVPYQIPYGVIVPRELANLLVPVAASSSHVGFCALRLEPIWTSLGQAAGHAAHLANSGSGTVQQVPVTELQARLHASGAATIYVSDVLPGHPDFARVQWWGTRGGLHGLAPEPEKPGQRGPNIHGQYYQAFPNHAARLDEPLDERVASRWLQLARQLGPDIGSLPPPDGKVTRGQWLRLLVPTSLEATRSTPRAKPSVR